ncbi:hypothetical protein [Nitrososphaera sp.]|uniref:hypothetical protein n=1 Tax=Nitrososphaera sp. TaxID=1971748 RepID=UPI002ED9479C
MGNGIGIPVIAGLVIGIAFVLLFSFYSAPFRDIVTGTTKSGISVSLADLKDQHALNEPLNFTVTAKGRGALCDDPTAKILNADSGEVAYDIPHVEVIYECLSDPVDIDITWTLRDIMYPYSPVLIGESGHYILEVELGGVVLKKDFIIYDDVLSP